MRGPISLIQCVGAVEAVHDLLDARATVDRERSGTSARPRLEIELAEIADVIRVEVREQHTANRRQRNAPEDKVLDRLGSGINHVELTAGKDRHAGLRAARAREWRRRSTDRNTQGIVFERRRVDRGRLLPRGAIEDLLLHAGSHQGSGARCEGNDHQRARDHRGTPAALPTAHARVRASEKSKKRSYDTELDGELPEMAAEPGASGPDDAAEHDGAENGYRCEDPGAAHGPCRGSTQQRQSGEQPSEVGLHDRKSTDVDGFEAERVGRPFG